MHTQKHLRRSREQWLSIIEQQKESGLSVPQFCKEHDIGYASFSAWKRRTQSDNAGSDCQLRSVKSAQFIDLSSLPQPEDNGWRITLRLGNGVELELSQA